MSVIFSFCKLTSVLRPGKRDLYLGKILQWPVHVLLFHLGDGDDEHGEHGEDDEDGEDEKEEGVHVLPLNLGGEQGEDDEDVHLVGEDSEDVENMEEKDSREGGDEAYKDEVSEEQTDTSQRGRYASPRKMPCKSHIKMF